MAARKRLTPPAIHHMNFFEKRYIPMKKFTKYLALLGTLLTFAVAALGFAACGGNADSYTVYVKDADGNPYTDVTVQVCATGDSGFCDF